jgi:hypothetical protein
MKARFFVITTAICVFLTLTFVFTPCTFAKKRIVFGGGPAGGTFQVVANAIQVYKPVKQIKEFTVKPSHQPVPWKT